MAGIFKAYDVRGIYPTELDESTARKIGQAFRKVVLIQWPQPNMWRIGFVTGHVSDEIKKKLGADVACVFIPHTPNPASGFVHYAPKVDLISLDWPIEEGLKVVVSGGVVQPGVVAPADSQNA